MYGELTIPHRFNGPPSSGNGGYSAGALAEALLDGGSGAVQVTLRKPPPLETPMLLNETRDACFHEGTTILEAKLLEEELEIVEPVSYDEALTAMLDYAGIQEHPFPTCFVCGPAREDGLAIYPGPTSDRTVASIWTPDPSLGESEVVDFKITWAAMDCIGAWTTDVEEHPSVLGRMACSVDAAPRIGEPHVLVGRLLGVDGRKTYTLGTLYDADGRIVARSGHIWIEVDPKAFG